MKRRTMVIGGVALAAGAIGFMTGPLIWELVAGDTPWLDEAAFEDLDGRRRRLSEWRSRALVLNFWASWCEPCREEIPLLMTARDRHGPRGLEVVGIAIDLAARAREFAKA